MTVSVSTRPSLFRAAALLMGASFFAYLIGLVVHESGHYVASLIQGVPEPGIVLHPFDQSHNNYGGDISQALGTPLRLALNGAVGPVFNVLLGVAVSLLLWRRRSSRWLPFLMWGSLALLVEGVGMIIGLVDYPNVRSDWVDVMAAGVPPVVIGLFAAVLLVVGWVWIQLLLPLAGVGSEDPFWRKLIIFLAGIPMLQLGAVIYLTLLGPSGAAPEGYVLQSRQIALAASVGLVATIAALHRPLFSFLNRISHSRVALVAWGEAGLAMGLGAAMVVFQLVFFNEV